MNIAFYAPMKPLDHPTPSGDRTIGRGLTAFLEGEGFGLVTASRFRSRGFCVSPKLWAGALAERGPALDTACRARPAVWLTYHAYYKAPDVLGPGIARKLGIPYVVFQGIYSTKVRRHWKTWLGYALNRRALLSAAHVFTNRLDDLANLRRLLPEERLTAVVPGIDPAAFAFDGAARQDVRRAWGVGDAPVVLTAAMFRPGVKTRGLVYLMERLGELARSGSRFVLAVAGDGETRDSLMALAQRELPGRVIFLGLVPREDMVACYSASDLFAFPGIEESLGMVYLEGQAAGLPVVAFANGGVPEVVAHGVTGILVPPFADAAFRDAMSGLIADKAGRRAMGERAEAYVRERHDFGRNHGVVAETLRRLSRARG